MINKNTIIALATPNGLGAISVIRISGLISSISILLFIILSDCCRILFVTSEESNLILVSSTFTRLNVTPVPSYSAS